MDLYKKDTFLNKNFLYLFNRDIIEYDMEEAGFSLIQEFHLLPEKKISQLKTKGKQKRKIEIGLLQRKDEKFKKELKLAFEEARKLFFEENHLEVNDILSIKKDAIFTQTRCDVEKIGKHINFRKKHTYTSYLLLTEKKMKPIEIYYSPFSIEIKGISNSVLSYHEEYMLTLFRKFFHRMETTDSISVISYLRRFIDKYKYRELDLGYYRNFNVLSNYTILGEPDVIYMEYDQKDIMDIDISYNYFHILLKLLKIPL